MTAPFFGPAAAPALDSAGNIPYEPQRLRAFSAHRARPRMPR
jgi:hypothetical protein